MTDDAFVTYGFAVYRVIIMYINRENFKIIQSSHVMLVDCAVILNAEADENVWS